MLAQETKQLTANARHPQANTDEQHHYCLVIGQQFTEREVVKI